METPLDRVDSFLTPTELFYVRSHSPAPKLELTSYGQQIQGSYTVAGNTITVTNNITAEKPDMVTCKRVSDEVKDWLT